jgi:hypothetical protein
MLAARVNENSDKSGLPRPLPCRGIGLQLPTLRVHKCCSYVLQRSSAERCEGIPQLSMPWVGCQ